MLDVHAPHEPINSWRAFFTHIATIVVGLFIAVGIEQTVEFFHHREQSNHLQEQMRAVFDMNIVNDQINLAQCETQRAYLTELRAAIDARLRGLSGPAGPPVRDARVAATVHVMPSLAPYDAAKQNGTIALLPYGPLSIYNRIDFQRQLLFAVDTQWLNASRAFTAYEERFTDSRATLELGDIVPAPDLSVLSMDDLREYMSVVSTFIKATDTLESRYQLLDLMFQTALKSPKDENELVRESLAGDKYHLPEAPASSK